MRNASATWVVMAALLTAALVSSCGVLSGLDSLGVVDCAGAACNGGGTEGGTVNGDGQASPDETSTPGDAGPDTQGGPAACDTTTDPTCLPLPPPSDAGWTLAAFAPLGDSGAPPACPTGLDVSNDVNEGPTPRSAACQCPTGGTGCTVTSFATCPIAIGRGNTASSCGQSGQLPMSNSPAGTCLTDLSPGQRDFGEGWSFTPQASGGACSPGAPVLNASQVDYASRWRVCDNVTRCSGGVCNAVVPVPFAACLISAPSAVDPGLTCPAGFPTKHVVGAGASFTCGKTCTCGVNKSCSAGTVTFYNDGSCSSGATTVAVDGICRAPFNNGFYSSYKSNVTPTTTTCTSTGSSTATPAQVTSARTVCCR